MTASLLAAPPHKKNAGSAARRPHGFRTGNTRHGETLTGHPSRRTRPGRTPHRPSAPPEALRREDNVALRISLSRSGSQLRCLGQFRLSSPPESRWGPRSSGEVSGRPCHSQLVKSWARQEVGQAPTGHPIHLSVPPFQPRPCFQFGPAGRGRGRGDLAREAC